MLAYLSCCYTLNHYLVLQQALGIDPNLGGITNAKCQLGEIGRCCTEEQAQKQAGRTPPKVPEHTATERWTGFSSNSLASMHPMLSALSVLWQDAPASTFCIGQYVYQTGSSCLSLKMAQEEGLLRLSLKHSGLRFESHGAFEHSLTAMVIQWGKRFSYKVTLNLQRIVLRQLLPKNKKAPQSQFIFTSRCQ